ncbi:GATA transcription factor-like protein [Tasmannia lanceolata]|uniref:GATA transcription factor-like protein n=1 Tax=Tasmannia lanceolata TaxID=3420 RepID=UPI0040642DF7
MQSRVVAIGSSWILSIALIRSRLWSRSLPTSTPFKTADPAIHSQVLSDEDEDKPKKAFMTLKKTLIPTPPTPYASPPSIKCPDVVSPPIVPLFLQKRQCNGQRSSLEDASCVGWDGAPYDDLQLQQEDEDYYKDHRPSPLSQIEFVDTRKPITRATDGGAVDDEVGGDEIVLWREEQLDSVDEALSRAETIFRESAEKGDPDSPQSRVLAALLRQREREY